MPINYENFPKAVPPEHFTSKLDTKPNVSISLKDFTDQDSSLDHLAKRLQYMKELLQQMKDSQQDFLQKEQGFTKTLFNTDKNFLETMFTFIDFIL